MSNEQKTSNIRSTITQYCALHRDQLEFQNQVSDQKKQFVEKEAKYKNTLLSYLQNENKTCVPVDIPVDPTDELKKERRYLRIKTSTTTKSVTESTLEYLRDTLPTTEELDASYEVLREKNPTPTLIEVYTHWALQKIKEKNTTHKTYFELDKSKERVPKGQSKKRKRSEDEEEKESVVQVPDNVLEDVIKLYRNMYDHGRLKKTVSEKKHKIEVEKQKHEPELISYLATKPKDQQFQKVSMKIDNEPKPYFLRCNKGTSGSSSLSISKAKPLIEEGIKHVVSHIRSEAVNQPYSRQGTDLFASPAFRNNLFTSLKDMVSNYKHQNTKSTTKLCLDARGEPPKKRSRGNDDDDDEKHPSAGFF